MNLQCTFVVYPPLGWSPVPSFLVIMAPSGDTRGPSVVFEAVDMPCQGPFNLSHIADYIYDFRPLPDPDVGLAILVCDVEHTFSFWSVLPQGYSVLVWSVSSAPYVILAAQMSYMYTCLFRQLARLFLNISRCLRMPPCLP